MTPTKIAYLFPLRSTPFLVHPSFVFFPLIFQSQRASSFISRFLGQFSFFYIVFFSFFKFHRRKSKSKLAMVQGKKNSVDLNGIIRRYCDNIAGKNKKQRKKGDSARGKSWTLEIGELFIPSA